MKKINLLILSFFLFSKFASALSPRDKEVDFSALIGKRMFESPLNEWLEKYSYKTAFEDLQTDGPALFLKHYEKGYSMIFDINMVLNSITLYNKGGKYETFKGKLPFNLKFGMNRDSLYRLIDLRFAEVDDNPYALVRAWNNTTLQLMFNSKGLNQVNIITSDTMSRANDINFVRLVGNGLNISGDCDSLTGKMSWNDGQAMYEGQWKNNMPHGKGYFKDQNDNWYKGEFKYGFFWGNGQMNVANLYNYEGEFLMSRRHGNGLCKFMVPKGESYEGQWKEDAMNGLGKYVTTPKHYYYGNMKNDKFNGHGKLVTPDGWMEGIFKEGIPHGIIKQFLKLDNIMVEGEWVEGKREGKFKITDIEKNRVTYKMFKGDIEIVDK